jgi:lysophospholipase L1-like esterase
MFGTLVDFFARPMIAAWLAHSRYSWRRLPLANDSPHVHAPGANPDRLLVAGDGATAGVGVLSHDLGLSGYLARRLSVTTGRATDVDIIVRHDHTAESTLEAIAQTELSRFDAIILSVGANEALGLVSPKTWNRQFVALLDRIQTDASSTTKTIVLSIPFIRSNATFPTALAVIVDRHAFELNRLMRVACEGRPGMTFVVFNPRDAVQFDGAHTYQRWADILAPQVAALLDPAGVPNSRTEVTDEPGRQQALDDLGILGSAPDPGMDRIARTAQGLFDTPMSAVTFIDNDRQWIKSSVGVPVEDIDREDAFCDITIRRSEHFVIEDTQRDARFAGHSFAHSAGVRFYAGYPIESPDGHRVGALCIMDTRPRSFSRQDALLLRNLALEAQSVLWGLARI